MTCQYIFSLPNLKAEVSFECYSSVHPFVHKPSYLLVEQFDQFKQTWDKVSLGKWHSSLFKWSATPFS